MDNDQIYLTKMLRGENMGVKLYDMYLKKIPQGKFKRDIEKIRGEHIRHRTRIENIMQTHNMEISSEIGVQGLMSEAMTAVRLMFRHDPKKVIEEAYRGEKMGIEYSEKYLNEFSESIRPDMEKLINESRECAATLKDILGNL
jgi:rubrerythrin